MQRYLLTRFQIVHEIGALEWEAPGVTEDHPSGGKHSDAVQAVDAVGADSWTRVEQCFRIP